MPAPVSDASPPERRIFCNRTLNLRRIEAIGYDMDYTLVHYRVDDWERRAYGHLKAKLLAEGWPVEDLEFIPDLMVRGLVVDQELGNIVKASRFGYVIRACHGTRFLPFEELRKAYARTSVDLSEPRWVFLNTFFSLSEACIYAQLVDRLDEGRLKGGIGYESLYSRIRHTLDEAHMEGILKGEIVAEPDRYIVPDAEAPLALLDQRQAGKKLLLITNSEWPYTRKIMGHAFDPYLPDGVTWRELFDLVLVAAGKPSFFSAGMPLFLVRDERRGLLVPCRGFSPGRVHLGGSAGLVEEHLGLSGEEILYVGDHLYADVHVTKSVLRWRTALIVRELEEEIHALVEFADDEAKLAGLMAHKEALEQEHAEARLFHQRRQHGFGATTPAGPDPPEASLQELRQRLESLDQEIAPLARETGRLHNRNWGLLMRAGNDKSKLARQVERYADVYTSRVSNFLRTTPYAFLRAPRGNLPHDHTLVPEPEASGE
jgi:5'-nucleotidase